MQPALDVQAADDVSTLLKALVDKPMPASYDIERLRQAFYREGAIDRRRAAEIIHANRKMRAHTGCWTEFYLEALANFFLEYQDDAVVLPLEFEDALISWLGDATVSDLGERRLILRVFLRAGRVSERFERWVLHAIEDNLLRHAVRWNDGGQRRASEIDVLDMQLVRCLIGYTGKRYHAVENTSGIDFLLNLDRNATRFADPVRWRRLLAEGLARQVFAGSSPGCGAVEEQDADRLNGLSKQLEGRFSPDEAVSLREDVLLARAWATSIGQGSHEPMFRG